MHRISERVFQAKADLALCERAAAQLAAHQASLRACGLARTAAALETERKYWALRAESDRAMIAVETGGEW